MGIRMKFLIVSAFCIFLTSLTSAQAIHSKPARDGGQTAVIQPKREVLPQSTLEFKQVGDALPVSADAAFVGEPVCADGKFYFNAIMLPGGEKQIIAVSPKGEVSNYSLASEAGLVNVSSFAMDAEGSDIYVLVNAARRQDLLDQDVDPASKDVWRHTKMFIIHLHGNRSTPDEISLDLPFAPMKFAATNEGKYVFLGLDRANQTPVLAVVGGSGEVERYIDAYNDFGTSESILANAPQQMKSEIQKMPTGTGLGLALVAAQFVHYRDSLLLLIPGSKAKVFTIRNGGAVESMTLHLPAGLEADSLVPSDNGLIVRATNGAANGNMVLAAVDPATGNTLRII